MFHALDSSGRIPRMKAAGEVTEAIAEIVGMTVVMWVVAIVPIVGFALGLGFIGRISDALVGSSRPGFIFLGVLFGLYVVWIWLDNGRFISFSRMRGVISKSR